LTDVSTLPASVLSRPAVLCRWRPCTHEESKPLHQQLRWRSGCLLHSFWFQGPIKGFIERTLAAHDNTVSRPGLSFNRKHIGSPFLIEVFREL
jgi:hypothetical protein